MSMIIHLFSHNLSTQRPPEKMYPSAIPFSQVLHADDKDSGENAHVIYSVDDRNFSINERGEISACIRLDADQRRHTDSANSSTRSRS
ncbi:unnamed protein product [Toxocara canis]|uniref:Cadherin domain-containing protein n=1 Tax=Toxocara canis TaxID=6265 RepID=A0A183U411_TOXCA|nr:unnamed protein product [Toxocara canis]